MIALFLFSCAEGTSYVRLDAEESSKIKNLAIVVNGDPNFTYIDKSTKDPRRSHEIGGAFGDAIVSSHHESLDREIAKSISPKGESFSCKKIFTQNLLETLKDANHFDSIEVRPDSNLTTQKRHDALVTFHMKQCGSRISRKKEGGRLVPFVVVSAEMKRYSDNKVLWKENQTIVIEARNTLASRLAMQGVPLVTIAALLRHSTTNLVRRYAHLSPNYLKEAVEEVSSFGNGEPTQKGGGVLEVKDTVVSISTVTITGIAAKAEAGNAA